jgi:hypothetical protein
MNHRRRPVARHCFADAGENSRWVRLRFPSRTMALPSLMRMTCLALLLKEAIRPSSNRDVPVLPSGLGKNHAGQRSY